MEIMHTVPVVSDTKDLDDFHYLVEKRHVLGISLQSIFAAKGLRLPFHIKELKGYILIPSNDAWWWW